jgi:hypothetical protein
VFKCNYHLNIIEYINLLLYSKIIVLLNIYPDYAAKFFENDKRNGE